MQKKVKKTEKLFNYHFNLFKKQSLSVKCTQASLIDNTMSLTEQNAIISNSLGVGIRTVQRWRSGGDTHPSAERLLFNMKMGINQNGHWSGWQMKNNELVSPSGETVTPAIVGRLWLWRNERIAANAKITDLQRQVEKLSVKTSPIDRELVIEALEYLQSALALDNKMSVG